MPTRQSTSGSYSCVQALSVTTLLTLTFSLYTVVFYAQTDDPRLAQVRQRGGGVQHIRATFPQPHHDTRRLRLPKHVNECPLWYKLAASIQNCLKNKLLSTPFDKMWTVLHERVDECGTHLLYDLLDVVQVTNLDETKVVVMPSKYPESTECTLLTAGVGGDVLAEQRLQKILPKTRFIGADPIEESGAPYRTIGEFHQVGLGARTGSLNASVMINGTYEWRDTPITKMADFLVELRDVHGVDMIDYLWMDIEGAEYDLLPMFGGNHELSRTLTICQLNVEVHGPLGDYHESDARFAHTIQRLLTDTQFLPLHVTKPINHQRLTLIDWQSPVCVDKFYAQWCGKQ